MRSEEEIKELYRFAERDFNRLTKKHDEGKVSDAHFLRMSGYYKGKMCGLWCALGCPDNVCPSVSDISEVRYENKG